MSVIRCTFQRKHLSEFIDNKVVLTIGVFDGVHLGHRFLIEQSKILASELSAENVIYTFWPYPHHLGQTIIYSRERKYAVLHSLGIKYIVEHDFSNSFSLLNAVEFIDYLTLQIPFLVGICVGQDFRFGCCRGGDVNILQDLCSQRGIVCKIFKKYIKNGTVISSTYVRQLLKQGNIELVNELLGEQYF